MSLNGTTFIRSGDLHRYCIADFVCLVICRMLVGVGEASFVALAAPFIGTYPTSLVEEHLSQYLSHV